MIESPDSSRLLLSGESEVGPDGQKSCSCASCIFSLSSYTLGWREGGREGGREGREGGRGEREMLYACILLDHSRNVSLYSCHSGKNTALWL